jgi:hypothetical protein
MHSTQQQHNNNNEIPPVILLVFGLMMASGATAQANSVIRTSNSIDIQLCVQTAFLTPQRDAFLQALTTHLMQDILNSNALYLDRQYTTVEGGLCYLFVYQAPGPDNAISVLERLAEQTAVYVPLGATTIQCSVEAAQWSGDALSYLGAPFPGLWTVNDLILWGACFLTVLCLCSSGLCCYSFIVLHRVQLSNNEMNKKKMAPPLPHAGGVHTGSEAHAPMASHLKLPAPMAKKGPPTKKGTE